MFPLGLFLDIRLKADKYKRFSFSLSLTYTQRHRHPDTHTWYTHTHTYAHKGQHIWGLEGYTGYNKKQSSSIEVNFFEHTEVLCHRNFEHEWK